MAFSLEEEVGALAEVVVESKEERHLQCPSRSGEGLIGPLEGWEVFWVRWRLGWSLLQVWWEKQAEWVAEVSSEQPRSGCLARWSCQVY